MFASEEKDPLKSKQKIGFGVDLTLNGAWSKRLRGKKIALTFGFIDVAEDKVKDFLSRWEQIEKVEIYQNSL
jgi:hypothetical protein